MASAREAAEAACRDELRGWASIEVTILRALLAELEQAEQREAALVEALRDISTSEISTDQAIVFARAALAAHEQAKP